jgi:hypothetical protein
MCRSKTSVSGFANGIFLFLTGTLLSMITVFRSATSTSRPKWTDFAVGQRTIVLADRKFPVGEGKAPVRERNFELPDVKNCGR